MSSLFGISTKEQALFAKRLSFLVHAGVPILESLRMLKDQSPSRSKTKMLEKVMADVANGQFLSSSLGKFRRIFDDFAINLIKVGEVSGTLDENLNYLSEELKKKQALKRKVIGALVYPALIILATFGITGLLTIYVFPKILPVFESLNAALPLSTRILIWMSNFLTQYGLYVLGAIFLVFFGFAWLVVKKKRVHLFVDRLTLSLPLMGRIFHQYHMANFCRTFGLLLRSGVRVVDALKVTADTMTNLVFHNELHAVAVNVSKGEKIAKHLATNPRIFDPILTQMIAIGETTGSLSETLLYLSDMYEGEVDDSTKNLSSAIEPVLMIFMGMLVGFIAVSIITPIYEITQSIKP